MLSLAICSAAPNHQGAISGISDLMSFLDCHFSILSGNQFCKVLRLKVHVYFLQKFAECELIKVLHFDKTITHHLLLQHAAAQGEDPGLLVVTLGSLSGTYCRFFFHSLSPLSSRS